jgi:UDP-N-acetylmuramoyl-L-alanyl-D-glutamate--2,6-diaminopimelate ligase
MRLSAVLQGCPVVRVSGSVDVEVSALILDSRQVVPGAVFFAVRGMKADGNAFVPVAIAGGAVAVVSALPPVNAAAVWIQVQDERAALAAMAANYHGRPMDKLRAAGITGTNGKTTTAYLTESILAAAGWPAAVFGTIEYRGPGFRLEAERTTPEAPELQSLFARVVQGGWKHAVMEVSSHAIELKRVEGLRFEVAAFTNLTRDHLDLHTDMRSYFLAKKRLFTGLDGKPPRVLVLNIDDPQYEELRAVAPAQVLSYGLNPAADVCPLQQTSQTLDRIDVAFKSPVGELQIRTSLLGRPNLYNIGAAIGIGIGFGASAEAIRQGVADLRGVPGRFESVQAGQSFRVFVDYAHTDDALERLLAFAREVTAARLIVVFGCGGDRDRTKRPLMGEIAGRGSDFAIVTSDNPRSEDPAAIAREVELGLLRSGAAEGVRYRVVLDRREAIRQALDMARTGDTVVLAGKGHETYQVIGDRTLPFDDREIARELLNELTARRDR